MLLALASLPTVSAQSRRTTARSAADSVLLSQSLDGDYMVRKYLVKHDSPGNSDFAVRYRINLSTMSPNLDDNNRELAGMKAFMDSLAGDPMIHLNSVKITGYASPDGVEASNKKLAYARAVTLKEYLENRYDIIKRYDVGLEGIVEDWAACEKGLERSNVAGRDKALALIRGGATMVEKQRTLKSMPAVWDYLKVNVLPKLRYADVEFAYNRDEVVVTRTLVNKPKPAPVVADNKCCCCGAVVTETETFVEDLTNGLIVEMDEVDVDWY